MYILKENSYKNVIGSVICETTATISDPKIISETKGRRIVAEGVLQTAEETNRNGRNYEKKELFPQITCARTKELIYAGYMRAESGHPMDINIARQQTIDPTNVCANFRKMWTSGNDVMAWFIGTNNALGDAFDQDLRDGYKPAWSLRALGTLEETSRGAFVKNLKLITYDHVIYPSHPGAYTKRIVSEACGINLDNMTGNVPSHTIKYLKENNKLVKSNNGLYLPKNILAESGDFVHEITNGDVIEYVKQESSNFKLVKECFDLLYDDIKLVNEGKSIQLRDKSNNTFIINVEQYIRTEIMNSCYKRR